MLSSVRPRVLFAAFLLLSGVYAVAALGQSPLHQPELTNRIRGPIDETQVVTLAGNVHPRARAEFDRGVIPGETFLAHMVLELEPSAAQQAELDTLVKAQYDPASPLFHRWLSPADYGARFGASPEDIAHIATWLGNHGFMVDEVPASNRLIIFSGTAEGVAETFHTEIHRYQAAGAEHIANVQDPQIPAALAGIVGGVVSLHDFRRQSQIASKTALAAFASAPSAVNGGHWAGSRPAYTSGSAHYLFPADWATIYDLNSLYSAGKTGSGTSIAIVGRSNINLSDVVSFRSLSGLPANNPQVILVGANPGLVPGDQDESTLDVEWSGGTAPAATVKFVVGASTATADGVDLSAQYVVNHALAQVVSTSYGSCEQEMGATELAFYNNLWQQAAAQGMSAFVSSGDSGAAGCNGGSSAKGTVAAVNGLCSSPYSTCVGGTEFNEPANTAPYWSSTNSASYSSALAYIPEKVWNESASDGGSGLWASTGGTSVVYAQPSWQKGVAGASAGNGMRTVPDIAMTAAGHDGYVIEENGSLSVIAGTSAASPSFAGLMALVVQSKGGTGQGNANPGLYSLLNASTDPFHATPSGNNSVPGVTGFTASGSAYNLATGLGSVDGGILVSQWNSGSSSPAVNFAMTQSASSGSAVTGKTATFTVGVTESGSAKNSVSLTVKAPTGITASVSPASITPGTAATVTLSVGSTATAGAQTVTVTGSNSSGTQSVSYSLTVTQPPTLTLSSAPASASVVQGATTAVSLAATTGGGFTGNITWSVSGLPSGVTAAWSANPQTPTSANSTNTQTLKLTASSTAGVASTAITVTAAGAGLTASKQVTLAVTSAPGTTLAASSSSLSLQSLGSGQVTVTATPKGGLTVASGAAGSSISITSGLPKGVTAAWSTPSVNSSGVVSWTLTLTGSATAVAGSSTLGLSAQVVSSAHTSYAATSSLPVTVTLSPPTLTLGPAASVSLTLIQAKTVQQAFTLTGNATFS